MRALHLVAACSVLALPGLALAGSQGASPLQTAKAPAAGAPAAAKAPAVTACKAVGATGSRAPRKLNCAKADDFEAAANRRHAKAASALYQPAAATGVR